MLGQAMTKNLSRNVTVSPEDLGKDQMQQADVVFRFLLPPHEDAAVAVQPRVDALDNPALRTVPAAALRLFLTARTDVRGVASSSGCTANGFGVIALVPAEMLFTPVSWSRPGDGNTIESGINESLIMHIGASHGQADRHASPVGKHRPFHAEFTAIRRVFPRFFPRPAAPSSAPRPDSATAKRCHAERRSVPTATSTVGGRHPAPSTLESSDGSCCRSRNTWARLSTGNQCAAHSRCHSLLAATSPVAVRRVEKLGTWATAAECAAKTHPTSTNSNRETPSSRDNPPCQTEVLPHGIQYVFRRSQVLG